MSQYKVVFRGDLLPGHKLVMVKQKLVALFKTDLATIDTLFVGGVKTLKHSLDAPTAKRYRQVLRQAGADVEVVLQSSTPSSNTVASSETPQATVDSQRATPTQGQAGATEPIPDSRVPIFELAAVGVDLVPAPKTPKVDLPDISHLTLRLSSENLVDLTELPQPKAVPVSNLEVGLSLPGDWLVTEAEQKETDLPSIEAPDLEVDPAGCELGQLLTSDAVVEPDISGLALVQTEE